MSVEVPFHIVTSVSGEIDEIASALKSKTLAGEGPYSKKCAEWFRNEFSSPFSVVTPSCTAALEMALIVGGIRPGDEVILPSFTFSSTATACVLLGAVPVFVDCRQDTFNIDESKIEEAITSKTKAVLPVHYAGVSCEMDEIRRIADKHNLLIIEDAAQAIGSRYKDTPVGDRGDMSAFSFHETKNLSCGEGGAFVLNTESYIRISEIARDKGTDRSRFIRGEVNKYSWHGRGSSYVVSDLQAALLWKQLSSLKEITERRRKSWQRYFDGLAASEKLGHFRLPIVPKNCYSNAHIFNLLTNSLEERESLHRFLKSDNISTTSHYEPLHASAGGREYGRTSGELNITTMVSEQILRLPMFDSLSGEQIDFVIDRINQFYRH